jgi:hypothetical protein
LDIRAEGGYVIWWPLHFGQHGPMGDVQPLPAGLIDERRMDLELPAEVAAKLPPMLGTSQDFQRDLQRITDALAFIDPTNYDAWLMVGMALHHSSGGADDGLELWDAWSSGGLTGTLPDNYAGRADMYIFPRQYDLGHHSAKKASRIGRISQRRARWNSCGNRPRNRPH